MDGPTDINSSWQQISTNSQPVPFYVGMREPKLDDLIDKVRVTKWQQLGRKLGMEEEDLDDINENKSSVEGAREALFKKWLESYDNLTWWSVMDALKAIGFAKKARDLEKTFC